MRTIFGQCIGMGDYVHTGGYKLSQAHGISGIVRLMVDESTYPSGVNWLSFALMSLVVLIVVFSLRGPVDILRRNLHFSSAT